MTRTRKLARILAFVAVAALLGAARAGTTALVLTGATCSGATVSATVSNPTSTTQSGYLVLTVSVQGYGSSSVASIPLTLPPYSSAGIGATYPSAATLQSAGTSDTDHGRGIGESPDPIVAIVIVNDPGQ